MEAMYPPGAGQYPPQPPPGQGGYPPAQPGQSPYQQPQPPAGYGYQQGPPPQQGYAGPPPAQGGGVGGPAGTDFGQIYGMADKTVGQPIPEGWYAAVVEQAEYGLTRGGDKWCWKIRFRITTPGDQQGRVISMTLSVSPTKNDGSANDKGMGIMLSQLSAMGVPTGPPWDAGPPWHTGIQGHEAQGNRAAQLLAGHPCRIYVKHDDTERGTFDKVGSIASPQPGDATTWQPPAGQQAPPAGYAPQPPAAGYQQGPPASGPQPTYPQPGYQQAAPPQGYPQPGGYPPQTGYPPQQAAPGIAEQAGQPGMGQFAPQQPMPPQPPAAQPNGAQSPPGAPPAPGWAQGQQAPPQQPPAQ